MRILISTYGSRGDVQPMLGLGVALRELGAEVRFCAPADREFTDLYDRHGFALIPAFATVRDWIDHARRTGLALPDLSRLMVRGQYEILDAAAGCDAVVATGLFPARAAAQMVAERRGLRFESVHFCPRFLPSLDLPPLPFPGHPLPAGVTDPTALWAHNAGAMNALFGAAVGEARARIGLPPVENVRDHAFTRRPWLATDAALGPWRPSPLSDGIQTGAFLLADDRPLPSALTAFLGRGTPPVYVGFGSMRLSGAPEMARDAIAAIRAHGRRVVVGRGLAGLDAVDAGADSIVVDDIDHAALFPRVAAVIHHGGAGTTHAAARAGAPQVIVPQLADQPYWGRRVAGLGLGATQDGPVPTRASLTQALAIALDPATLKRAQAMAPRIRTDGATLAARWLQDGRRAEGAA